MAGLGEWRPGARNQLGIEPKPAVIAYSAMTHFLENSKLVEDVYPQERSTWGFLFRREDGKATVD